jgi:hypothetical protein
MFALSHHMGKCMMNFPLASYLSHIANFISHGEMHEEFPIKLFFLPFHISTFTSHEKMHEEFIIILYLSFCRVNFHIKWGNVLGICLRLPICLFILLTMIRRKVYHLWNLPQRIPFDWPHLWYITELCKFTLFSPCLWASFHSLISLLVISVK